jgi:diguanylate cyclase (GGDEF)-like protein
VDWALSIVGAIGVGAVLLHLRLRAVHELAESEFARQQLVEADPLTGLLNRRGLRSRVDVVWAGAQRRGEPVNVAFIDIVGMKTANDEHGHEFGDHLITEVAHAIREAVRGEDLVARWGGDEFLVLSKGEVPSELEMHDRILVSLKRRDAECADHSHADITVGAASSPADQFEFDELVSIADQRMYAQRRHR